MADEDAEQRANSGPYPKRYGKLLHTPFYSSPQSYRYTPLCPDIRSDGSAERIAGPP
jgi:hypothetical protein